MRHSRPTRSRVNIAVLALLAAWAGAGIAQELPQGGQIVSGQAQIGPVSGASLNIVQSSERAIIQWDGFSIGAGGAVSFTQPGASSAILNRVVGATPSTIAGSLRGNGQVFLVNPNGIAITAGGTVNIGGGFIASTLGIANDDFNAGLLRFLGAGTSAGVSNAGSVAVSTDGYVLFLGGTIANDGVVSAPMGKVMLASGEAATLDLQGDGFLQVTVPTNAVAADGRALVDVAGEVNAQGGQVTLRVATVRDAIRNVVNVPGRLLARSAVARDGAIVLDGGPGGQLHVSGQLDASGDGSAGRISTSGASLSVNGPNAAIVATSAAGTGGEIELTAESSISLGQSLVDASGAAGGGRVRIGGDTLGGGTLASVEQTVAFADATVRANALADGPGGSIVVWSDVSTDFAGSVSARGAGSSASGGLAEVSSGGLLRFTGQADLSAASGRAGTLLLRYGDGDTDASFLATDGWGNIGTATLQNALVNANVVVSTSGAGTQAGDIIVVDPVSWESGNALTLNAARDVAVNGSITASNGGELTLTAGRNIAVNGNIASAGAPLAVALNSSASAGSISISQASILTRGGTLTASASQSGSDNALVLTNVSLDVGTGTAMLRGNSASGTAISLGGTSSLRAGAGGTIAMEGTSLSGTGLALSAHASLATSGDVSLTGASTDGRGTSFAGGSNLTHDAGNLGVAGSSGTGNGVWLDSGTHTLSNGATGTFTITGVSSSGSATVLGSNASVTLSGGIGISGTSVSGTGMLLAGGNVVTGNSGPIDLTGTSSAGTGIDFGGSATLTASDACLCLQGATSGDVGIHLALGAALTSAGNVTLTGNSTGTTGRGIQADGNVITVSSGSLAMDGSSQTGTGMQLRGSHTFTNSDGTLALTGVSASSRGIELFSGASLALAGDATLTGSSTSGAGVVFDESGVVVSGGDVAFRGSSTSDHGVLFATSAVTSLVNNGAGTLSVSGVSDSAVGLRIGADHSLTTSGHVLLEGASSGAAGAEMVRRAGLTHTEGDLTLQGSSSSGTAVSLLPEASIIHTGAGTLNLVARGGMDLGALVKSTGGAVRLEATGTVQQSAGAIEVSRLLLAGAGATHVLNGPDNQIGSLAANTGSIDVHSRSALSTGSVLDTAGITTQANITLTSAANLTIASGAPVRGANPVLATDSAFSNLHGADAVTATSGRWLIYSAAPDGNTFGGLDSGNTALWNATFASLPPANVSATGHRYLFALQPTLTVTSLDLSKEYGSDVSAALANRYSVSGLQPGVQDAFLPDTANAYSGTPSLTSEGAAATASVANSPYAISLSAGPMASASGYLFAVQSNGLLTVTPRTLTYVAEPVTRPLGEKNPLFTGTLQGFVNGETAETALGGSIAWTSPADVYSPAGAYSIAGSGLSAIGGNYVFVQAPGNASALTIAGTPVVRNMAPFIPHERPSDALPPCVLAPFMSPQETAGACSGATVQLPDSL